MRTLADQFSLSIDRFNSQTDSSPRHSNRSFLSDLPLREQNYSVNNIINGFDSTNGVFLKRKQTKVKTSGQNKPPFAFIPYNQSVVKLSTGKNEGPTNNINEQLKRLEKGLNYEKTKNGNQRFARQKKLIKRIEFNKQNCKPEPDCCLDINSQQLQQIREESEQLYDVLLNLYRFYEREKENNGQLQKQLNKIEKEVAESDCQLIRFKSQLKSIKNSIEDEKREQKEDLSQIFRQLRKRC